MNILALVAHGDDEVIGCGGVLAQHARNGDTVYLVVLSDGVSSRKNPSDKTERDQSIQNSCKILDIRLLHRFDFKDNQLDRYPLLELIQAVEEKIAPISFDMVYTHSRNDLNIDHRIAHDIALTLFRPEPGQPVKAIYAFETLSATHWYGPEMNFKPQRFVEIAPECWEQKMDALNAYGMELRPFPHARSREAVTTLSTYRGCLAGVGKAEAFEVVRLVEPSW